MANGKTQLANGKAELGKDAARPAPGAPPPGFTDKAELRRRARRHVEDGAVTHGHRGDRQRLIDLLNDALATELVCVLRYKRHYFMAKGITSQPIADEFLQHAGEEQGHADELAARIVQLGGEPDLDPSTFKERAHSEYVPGTNLVDMIQEDLVAERIAIDAYSELIRFIGDDDPTTRRLIEGILATEEEHADELADLIASLDAGGR